MDGRGPGVGREVVVTVENEQSHVIEREMRAEMRAEREMRAESEREQDEGRERRDREMGVERSRGSRE
ncbi:hypothetical protein Sjap_004627 [Stephania japonica]|uniref:Uncharacterized protein n=1 Tax=Stephania japonica TaxID=461633 RepID=A0AAP0K3U9_9MAGN